MRTDVVRYFDEKTSSYCTQYLTSTLLGRARAEDLLVKFNEALDGLDKYQEHIINKDIDKKLMNLGLCGLHVVNSAFQTGHQASEWQINRLLGACLKMLQPEGHTTLRQLGSLCFQQVL